MIGSRKNLEKVLDDLKSNTKIGEKAEVDFNFVCSSISTQKVLENVLIYCGWKYCYNSMNNNSIVIIRKH